MSTTRIVYGVDFGMSTSSLAILGPDGSTRLVTDSALLPGSQHAVPTAVCLDDSGEGLLVGRAAVNAKYRRPEAYDDNFKLAIEVDASPVRLAGRSFTVVELVTAVLAFLRDRAREIDPRDPVATVLTVPVDWAKGRRDLMSEAAVAAGFPAHSLYLAEEPIAAIEYARSLHVVADSDTVLVYDLGGGTFDCAVGKPASSGQPDIRHKGSLLGGGHHFDARLREELGRRFPRQVGAVLKSGAAGDEPWRSMRLLETCETLKVRLSDSERVREPLTELVEPVNVEITRAEFESLIRDQIEQTMKCCQKMLGKVGLTWDQVDAVVPVGGSSRIPLVHQELEASAPGRVRTTADPDTAVVRGAALLARKEADRVLATSRPGPQVLAPPGPWNLPAVQEEPEVVGIRPYRPFNRRWLAWTWATLIPCVVAAGGLAWSHWRWIGAVTVTVLAVLALVGASRLTTTGPSTARLMVTGTGLMSLILLIVSMVLGYRALIEHHAGNGVAGWWALGAGLAALVSAIVQYNAGLAARYSRTSRAPAEEDATLVDRISKQQWFGPTQTPPDFAQRLFDHLRALRGFEFSADSTAAAFNYALAAGSRVLFISMLTSDDDRPELDAAAARWSSHLAYQNVIVKTILVVPGHELPTLRADEHFNMTDMTTTLAFVDTVGPWLDRDNRILLPVVRSLLRGPARAARSAWARPALDA